MCEAKPSEVSQERGDGLRYQLSGHLRADCARSPVLGGCQTSSGEPHISICASPPLNSRDTKDCTAPRHVCDGLGTRFGVERAMLLSAVSSGSS